LDQRLFRGLKIVQRKVILHQLRQDSGFLVPFESGAKGEILVNLQRAFGLVMLAEYPAQPKVGVDIVGVFRDDLAKLGKGGLGAAVQQIAKRADVQLGLRFPRTPEKPLVAEVQRRGPEKNHKNDQDVLKHAY